MKISSQNGLPPAYASGKTHSKGSKHTDATGNQEAKGVDTFTPSGKAQPAESSKLAPVTLESIKAEIKKQTYVLLRQLSTGEGALPQIEDLFQYGAEVSGNQEDPLGLGAYFTANPEDWEQVQNGIVPDHFNVENTGQRILDIWMGGIDESGDIAAQVEEIKSNINMAYGDVSGMLGGLPTLVTDTQEWIMGQLDDFVERKTAIE